MSSLHQNKSQIDSYEHFLGEIWYGLYPYTTLTPKATQFSQAPPREKKHNIILKDEDENRIEQ